MSESASDIQAAPQTATEASRGNAPANDTDGRTDAPVEPKVTIVNAAVPPQSAKPARSAKPSDPARDGASPKPAALRSIALMNQKGGVGKTTTAVNLGAALARAGHRVLMVDLDPQAHLTLHLGIEPGELAKTIYDLIADDDTSAFEVVQQVNKHLFVLPAEVNLAGVEAELAPDMMTGRAQRVLKNKCQALLDAHGFDYLLIDCPPSLGLLTINALTLANEVLVPMQAHFLALQGLSKLLETVQLVRQSFNPKLAVTGVVLCMHESQTILAGEVIGDLSKFLESARGSDLPWRDAVVLQPPVRRNIKLAESPSFGKSIFDYAPDCHGATDYQKLAAALAAHRVHVG